MTGWGWSWTGGLFVLEYPRRAQQGPLEETPGRGQHPIPSDQSQPLELSEFFHSQQSLGSQLGEHTYTPLSF